MNTYRLTHRSKCPNGQLYDTYDITICSQETIMVERILQVLDNAPEAIFQEDLATYLRNTLGAETTVTGWHYGIQIVSHRP